MNRELHFIRVLSLAVCAGLAGLCVRLYWVQVAEGASYRSMRRRQSTAWFRETERRYNIYDVSGKRLAYSKPVVSVAVTPDRVRDPAALAERLAPILHVPRESLEKRLSARGRDGRRRKFVWLKRKVEERAAQTLRALKEPALIFRTEFERCYDFGRLMCHVLGFVDVDERGLEGIERAAEPWIGQRIEERKARVDGGRRRIETTQSTGGEGFRGDAYLTLDLEFQAVLEEELHRAVEEHRAKWACGVALDPWTGEVLGLAVVPDFDPNQAGRVPAPSRRNRVLTDPYEPGSLLKPLIVAAALERGLVRPDDVFDCGHGRLRLPDRTIHDHRPFDHLSVREIVARSSNVGAVKIGLLLGKEGIYKALTAFGLGRATGVDLPGESPGRITPLREWTSFTLSSAPIGYELLATPLQMVRAFSVFANGGRLVRPRVLHEVLDPEGYLVYRPAGGRGTRVLSERTAGTMRRILGEVVEHGTGRQAHVDGIPVAGKTGTTRVLDPRTGRYRSDRHIASFIGFAPIEGARICLGIVVAEPEGAGYGGQVSAPVFARVIQRGMPVLQCREQRIGDRRRAIRLANPGKP